MADADLISYLDRRFDEISQKVDEKVDGLRDEVREEIRQTRAALEEEIRQTRAALEEADRKTREEVRQTRTALEEADRKTREEVRQTRAALEQEDRQTRVMVEGIRSEVRLVAEAVIGQGETFAIRQMETLKRVEEVMALIGPLYQNLNGRVTVLQEKAERETRDVLDVVSERYGKRA